MLECDLQDTPKRTPAEVCEFFVDLVLDNWRARARRMPSNDHSFLSRWMGFDNANGYQCVDSLGNLIQVIFESQSELPPGRRHLAARLAARGAEACRLAEALSEEESAAVHRALDYEIDEHCQEYWAESRAGEQSWPSQTLPVREMSAVRPEMNGEVFKKRANCTEKATLVAEYLLRTWRALPSFNQFFLRLIYVRSDNDVVMTLEMFPTDASYPDFLEALDKLFERRSPPDSGKQIMIDQRIAAIQLILECQNASPDQRSSALLLKKPFQEIRSKEDNWEVQLACMHSHQRRAVSGNWKVLDGTAEAKQGLREMMATIQECQFIQKLHLVARKVWNSPIMARTKQLKQLENDTISHAGLVEGT